MKRNFLVVLSISAIVASSVALAGCSSGKSRPNFEIPEEGFDTTKDVTIKFYTTQGDSLQNVTQTAIDEFEALYPNITIEHTQPSGGYEDLRDQISQELSVNQGPDLAYCYPDHVALYNKKKAVVTLDNLINDTTTDEDGNLLYGLTQEQQDDFIEGYWEEGRQFGADLMYTLPFSKSTEVLYYNVEFFEKNNLSVPDHWFSTGADDVTSMEYVCAAIKRIDPDSIPLGYDSASNWFITMCEQLKSPYTSATGNHYLFDNETNRDFVSKFKTWYENGWFTTQELYKGYTSALFTSTDTIKCYMCIGSSAGASHQLPAKQDISVPVVDENGNPVLDADGNPTYKTVNDYPFTVGIVPIPQADETNKKVISQGPSICLFNQGDAQKVMASWLFLRHLTTNVAFQGQFSITSGYVPVLKSVSDNPTYKAFMDGANGTTNLTALSAKVCMEQQEAYYTSPAFSGSSTARQQVGALLEAAVTGSKTIDQAFKDAISECEYRG